MFLTPFEKKDIRHISEAELAKLIDENKSIYNEYFDHNYLKSELYTA